MTTFNQRSTIIKDKAGAFLSFPIAPRRQFRRLIIVMTILALGAISFHLYLFQQIGSHTIFQVTNVSSSTAPTINEKKLSDVLSRYDAKSMKRLELQTNPPAVADPSR